MLTQIALGSMLVLGLTLWHEPSAAFSAGLGAMICVIPHTFLAARMMSGPTASPREILRAAWIGEIGKIALTVALFILAFVTFKPANPGWLFAGFILAQSGAWLALLLMQAKETTA